MNGGSMSNYPNQAAPKGSPRNVKNNNPGSLRISKAAWQGKIPVSKNTDKAFEQFETMVWGARAHIKNLQSWYNRGDDTLRKLITRWSPPIENATEVYIAHVARKIRVPAEQHLTLTPELLIDLCYAMSEIENANSPLITRQHYVDAFNKL